MKDNDKKYLYISGISLMMTLSSAAYVARTYQVLGKPAFKNLNEQVFLGGTILFAAAAIIFFCLHFKSKNKKSLLNL